jgi:dipeptidyl aminopeptidase/acylaminoacyl peptidase
MRGSVLVFTAFLWLGSVGSARAAERIPAEVFARGSQMRSAALSPSGRYVAYITHINGARVVVALDTANGRASAVVKGEGGAKDQFLVDRCWFKTDERLVCHFRGHDYDGGQPFAVSRLVAVDREGGNARVLVQNGRAGASQFQDRIMHRLPDDPSGVLIALDDDQDVYPSVFRLDINTGRLTTVVRQREPITWWFTDRRGVVRFGYGYQATRGVFIARDSAEAQWRTLARFQRFEGTHFSPLGFTSLPNVMLVFAERNGRDAVWEMDLRDDKDLELLYAHPEVDIDSTYDWYSDRRIVGFEYETDRPQVHMIDPEAEQIQRALEAALPGRATRVVDSSRDGKRLLVHSYSDVVPGSWYLFDVDKNSLRLIGHVQPELVGKPLAPMRTVMVPGPGGVKIPGYLTLPVGRGDKNLPAIVMPHGGPYGRDSWGYDELLQLLANRGYAVLQLNFRGSTGYGSAWTQAGFQGWGTVMHDDITAGARWLVSQGHADPARLCILGWSYGGYAALIGAVKEPELYRCAVSIAGVSDLKAIINEDARFYGGAAAARNATGDEDLDDQSPRRRAAEIRAPVLLVHGSADIQVIERHSRRMARALAAAGKPHETLYIEHGDHSLIKPAMRLALYQKVEEFLARHLDDGKVAGGGAAAGSSAGAGSAPSQ